MTAPAKPIVAAWRAVREELRAGPDTRSRKGVALLIVLVTLAVLSAFTVEFTYKSYVGVHVASNQRDEVVAYYHARAAMEVARLVIKSHNLLQNLGALGGPQVQKQLQNAQLWTLACEFANAFCTGKLNLMGKTFFDFDGVKGVGVEEGGLCRCRALPEDGRVNINGVDTIEAKNQLFRDLYLMMAPHTEGAEDRQQNEIDKDLAETVLNIIDHADEDTVRSDLVGETVVDSAQGEGSDYRDGKPKDAHFDTLAELQQVPGVEPRMYCQAAEEITPYAAQKVNVNTVQLTVLQRMLCRTLLGGVQESCYVPGLYPGVANALQGLPTMTAALSCLDVCRTLRQALMNPGFSNDGQVKAFFDNLPTSWQPRPVVPQDVLARLGTKSTFIRVETTGAYYNTHKSLTGVIDTTTGDYVYWREY